jgi:transcriptional regulator with XRE-family HTH domain
MPSSRNNDVSRGTETIASLLHSHLVREGMTDAEFAHLIGSDQTQISRWRRGSNVPRAVWIPALAECLGLDEKTVEAARLEGERVRVEHAGKAHPADPREELRAVRSELRRARAQIAGLEERLRKRP